MKVMELNNNLINFHPLTIEIITFTADKIKE